MRSFQPLNHFLSVHAWISSGCFQEFIFNFQQVEYDVLKFAIFLLILFGVCQASWCCKFMSATKFCKFFSITYLTVFFSCFLRSLLILGFWLHTCYNFWYCPLALEALFIFLNTFSPFISNYITSINLHQVHWFFTLPFPFTYQGHPMTF